MNLLRFKFNQNSSSAGPVLSELGPLERDVMKFVWQRCELHNETGSEVSVRDVYKAFEGRLAYTTLMTTLDRLYKKGLLNRRKDKRAFIYSPSLSPQELERNVARRIIDALLGRGEHGVEPVLACIVDAVGDHDRELLDDLDRLIQEKRSIINNME